MKTLTKTNTGVVKTGADNSQSIIDELFPMSPVSCSYEAPKTLKVTTSWGVTTPSPIITTEKAIAKWFAEAYTIADMVFIDSELCFSFAREYAIKTGEGNIEVMDELPASKIASYLENNFDSKLKIIGACYGI